ncbi:flagellar hook protein FlgE [Rhodanobacter sp. MP7CTX1]|jgi:flagellar hook protein FlgE|uniref:flagellar hook protein FlgE n=1 Tax=Rhodanobacter sp. MP7CTX1 TaxID=2723084 RepID=UPI00161144D2|nr:flagellar hook protein FlgE [Rhodanobacter sp. MP7CTX1]MBB6186270.1 flagellar hook protein FlgE [Rhodanobacter sp. MP7CTX1]
MALNQALSGINAAQSDLNVIANNIANAGTVGFKGSTAQFADIFAVTGLNLSATAIGSGAELTKVAQQFTQGDIETTSNSLDLAISGDGFFTINNGSGPQYTRDGAFHQDPNGTVVTADGSNLQVYPPNGAGGFDTSTLTNLQLNTAQSSATATSTITMSANLPASAALPADAPFNPSDSQSYTNATPLTIYDSQGGSHQATVYYVKTGNNTWNANLYVDGQSAGSQAVTFNSSGVMATPAGGNLVFTPVQPTNGATFPATMTVNLANTTQFGTAFSAGPTTQNGFQAGTLSNVDIGPDGVVTAYYSNFQSSQIGQVAMANFADPQGLSQLGNTTWAATGASGNAIMGTAGTGTFGSTNIQSGALETSNTSDTTAQLVDMIQAQQDYEANSQMLSTSDSLAQTLIQAVNH